MSKIEEPVLESALRLRHDPTLAPFMEWLRGRREHASNQCESLTGDGLMRAQGRAQELREILKFVEDAPSIFEKLRGR